MAINHELFSQKISSEKLDWAVPISSTGIKKPFLLVISISLFTKPQMFLQSSVLFFVQKQTKEGFVFNF